MVFWQYRLLKSAHLSEQHEQLSRVTLTELTYDNMKGQTKKIFGDPASLENVSHMPSVKVEPVDNNMQTVLNSKLVLPRVNQKVDYPPFGGYAWKEALILSLAGKATGKSKLP